MHVNQNDILVETLQHFQGIFRNGVSEYNLIQILKDKPFKLFNDNALNDTLALFQTHFVLFNALYQLQQRWRQDQTGLLRIHTTKILLEPYIRQHAAIGEHDALARYYLDWNNFSDTNINDVDAMLDSFWERMAGKTMVDTTELSHAKAILEIPEDKVMTKAFLKMKLRQLQHQHHPDKGGDPDKAKNLMMAYQRLLPLTES